jgi:hypothetical protein
MKLILSLLAAAAMTAALAVPALAQEPSHTVVEKHGNVTTEIEFQAAGTKDLDLEMLRAFSQVKQDDPKIASALARKPSLVADDGFVAKHPALQAYLEKYPKAREEIETSPGNFLTPVPGAKWASHTAAGIDMKESENDEQ